MPIKGTLDVVDIEEVLEWLEGALRTGSLELCNEHFQKTLHFVDGAIVAVASSEPADSLVQHLEASGLLTRRQVEAAVHIHKRTGLAALEVLRRTGAVGEEAVAATIEEEVRGAVWSTYVWEGGSFAFVEGAPATEPAAVSVRASDLFAEGQRRRARANEIRGRLADRAVRYERRVDPCEVAMSSPLEEELMSLLARPHTVLSLMLEARAGEYAVLEVLDSLLGQRAVTPVASMSVGGPQATAAVGRTVATMAVGGPLATVAIGRTSATMAVGGSQATAAVSRGMAHDGERSRRGEATERGLALLDAPAPLTAVEVAPAINAGGAIAADASDLLCLARMEMDRRSYDRALQLFRAAEKTASDDSRLRMLRESAELVYAEVLQRSELPPLARPVRVYPPEETPVPLGPLAARLYALMDGGRNVSELIAAAEAPAIDVLVALRDLRRDALMELAPAAAD